MITVRAFKNLEHKTDSPTDHTTKNMFPTLHTDRLDLIEITQNHLSDLFYIIW
jgi:hypothetical protein